MKVGLAGYGKMGQIREQSIKQSENFELIAIYDPIKDNILETQYIISESFEKLLETDIEVVFICCYVKFFSEYTIKALKAGKHVFCEKPPSANLSEMLSVIKEEKKSGKILKYGFNHRYHYSVMEAKKLIENKELGKILWVRGVYGKAGTIDYHMNWRNYKEFSGGGILIDQGIHMVDLVRFFLGRDLKCVHSYLTQSYWKTETEDNAFLLLKSDDGVIVNIHSSANQWKHKFLLEICLEEGYVNLDGLVTSTRSYSPEKLVIGRRDFEEISFAMGKPKEEVIYFENDNSWNFEIEEFYDSIKNKTKIKNGSSKDALEIMKIIDNVYKSSININ